jgi:diketogulonate reductase-like aldo/keto reductase
MKYVEAKGVRIPALGLGTWQLNGAVARRMVGYALDIGYRHIDTAQMYGN